MTTGPRESSNNTVLWVSFEFEMQKLVSYIYIVNYLLNHRLQWGKPDTLSLLTSTIEDTTFTDHVNSVEGDPPRYFSWETPARYLSIIQNDWPYSGGVLSSLVYF